MNIIRIFIILIWTAFCGILGILLMLITWSPGWIIKFLGHILWGPLVCAICGIKLDVKGLENISKAESRIYIANHSSLLDIAILARVVPLPLFFIAKKELKKVPILGQYMILLGHIFIDRGNKEKGMASMRAAAEKIKRGKNIISFPEGTRSKSGEVQFFKRGTFVIAKEGAIDIVPIGIRGAHHVLPSGSSKITPGKVHVIIGEKIAKETFATKSVEELAEYCQKEVVSLIEGAGA